LCANYAATRIKNDATYYKNNRGGKTASVFSFWSYKCAEFAAATFLTENYNFPENIPDTKIYNHRQKSWAADLVYNNVNFCGSFYQTINFHIKSVTAEKIAEGYPESFMFQLGNRYGKGGMDRILTEGKENDIVLMVFNPNYQIEETACFHIRGMVPWTYAKNYLENPIAKPLIGNKICLYTETLFRSLV
jgi:hypothetical protein